MKSRFAAMIRGSSVRSKKSCQLAIALAVLIGSANGAPAAQPATAASTSVAIPAQPLSQALTTFARQSGLQVVYVSEVTRGVWTQGASGNLTPRETLEKLLEGTGLRFKFTNSSTVTIFRPSGLHGSATAPSGALRYEEPANRAREAARGTGAAVTAAQDAQQRSAGTLQEVIVTATLRKEAAQNVAASLTVLGGPQLDNLGAKNINDVAALVPGLQLVETTPGYSVQVLRGISTGATPAGPTVAVYFDDTPVTATSGVRGAGAITPDPDMFDVQRIEVLKGPQGTLFGASSMGGLIHYVYNEPNLKRFEGAAEVGVEGIPDHGTGNSGHLVLNMPLVSDELAMRVAAFRIESPGFIDNVFRNQRDSNTSLSEGGRVAVLWKPTDSLGARLTSYYQRFTSANQPVMDVQPLTLQPTYGDLKTGERMPSSLHSKWFVNSLAITYDFPWATLLSSTSLVKQDLGLYQDLSDIYGYLFGGLIGGNASLLRSFYHTKRTMEEVRLTSPAGHTVDWIAGYYFVDEHAESPASIDQYQATGAADTLVVPNTIDVDINSKLRENAVYGDLTYHFGPAFDVQGGMRYSRVDQEFGQPFETEFGQELVPPVNAFASLSKTTYMGVARYHFSLRTMLYARVATGYRPGGPNDGFPGSIAPPSYQSDDLISYEIGLKGRAAANTLTYTADVYRVNWKDIQILGIDPVTAFSFFANGGKAHSQGLELSLDYRPIRGLHVGLSGSLNDAKLDESLTIPGATGDKGDELPYAPKVAATGTIDYAHPLTDSTSGFAGLTVTEVGSRRAYFAEQTVGLASLGPAFTSRVGPMPAYTTLDLRGGLTWSGVTATLYLRNVTNERGLIALNGGNAGVNLVTQDSISPILETVIQPRTIGVTLRCEFY